MNPKKSTRDRKQGWTRFVTSLSVVIGLSFVLAASGMTVLGPSHAVAGEKQITIASSSTTGTWYALMGIISKGLTDTMPGYAFTCISTSGSVENVRRIHMKEIELACVTAETAYMALYGKKPFKEKQNVACISAMYAGFEHICALADRNIRTVQDLKGKRIAYGLPGSTIANFNDLYFRAHGLDPGKDLKRVFVGQTDAINLMKDGYVDAFAYIQTPGEPALLDISASRKVTFLPVDKAAAEKIQKEIPYYNALPCPMDQVGMPGQTVLMMGGKHQFAVGPWVDADFVYQVTKNLYEHALSPAQEAFPGTRTWKAEKAYEGLIFPMHPGAERYYRERGIKK
jgi:TRAP transporter TAXI family solute receptor